MHVAAWAKRFLFRAEQLDVPVGRLSGGEQARVLIARLMREPADLLVLDEPTNDLDLETLELLEQQLVDWPGTLLLVSHDRRFLDNVVTSTMAFEGQGRVVEYVGGYEDWLRQTTGPGSAKDVSGNAEHPSGRAKDSSGKKKKRSFKEEREYQELPERIAALEAEQARLRSALESPDFYKEPGPVIRDAVARVEAIDDELLEALRRWDELDSIAQ
jgi:ATP-binding cassette subfamily F protein uup